MANESFSPDPAIIPHHGWRVALSGLGINLALGILYAWSLIKVKIGDTFGWDKERLNDPYALCCLVFAFAMILAGCKSSPVDARRGGLPGMFIVLK